MVSVVLRPPLRDLAGGSRELELEGATVGELVGRLEALHPRLAGWVLDEQGNVRPHVNVYVNGERSPADTPLASGDRVQILPAISGGAQDAEVLVGTRKGLFVLRGPRGSRMPVATRAFAGTSVEFATRDPRTGRYFASVTHGQYGPHLFVAEDPLGEWRQTEGPVFPDGADASVERIWVVQPGEENGVMWAGVAPAALFRSDDDGESWTLNEALWNHPTRPEWPPGAGGLCLHSICPWPGDPMRLSLGISAAGVWHTEDGGSTWERGVKGLVPRYLPEEAREDALALCVHNLHRSPVEPSTMYLQFHGGVYRSDDAGRTWIDIGDGLPADFGFPMVVDPRDPAQAFVVPLVSDGDRVTPDGRLRVFQTQDRGATWQGRGDGLPQDGVYMTVLRQAFGHDGRDPLGLYVGATSGDVFGSADGGRTWIAAAERLAPVLSVRMSE